MLKTLWIDLGNVLVTFDHMKTCRALAPAAGLGPDEVYRRLFESGLERRFDRGELSEVEFATHAAAALGLPAGAGETVLGAWAGIFARHDENLAALAGLAARFRLVLLSNTNPTHLRACEALAPELGGFHARVVSFEAGCRKPEPAIFAAALAASGGCAPGEVHFFDDGAEHVAAARAAGFAATLHVPGAALAPGVAAAEAAAGG